MRSAISVWVRSSTKRIFRIRRSRGGMCPSTADNGRVELHQLVALVLAADQVPVGGARIVVGAGTRRVQRDRLVGLDRLQRVDHLLGVELEVLGQLVGGGRVAALVGDALLRVAHLQRALLRAAGHVHRPAGVAEVAAHLAEDRRDGEGLEGVAAFDVVAVHRLEQAERGDLKQVLEGLGGAAVAPRQAASERHEAPARAPRGRRRRRGAASARRARADPQWSPASVRGVGAAIVVPGISTPFLGFVSLGDSTDSRVSAQATQYPIQRSSNASLAPRLCSSAGDDGSRSAGERRRRGAPRGTPRLPARGASGSAVSGRSPRARPPHDCARAALAS